MKLRAFASELLLAGESRRSIEATIEWYRSEAGARGFVVLSKASTERMAAAHLGLEDPSAIYITATAESATRVLQFFERLVRFWDSTHAPPVNEPVEARRRLASLPAANGNDAVPRGLLMQLMIVMSERGYQIDDLREELDYLHHVAEGALSTLVQNERAARVASGVLTDRG